MDGGLLTTRTWWPVGTSPLLRLRRGLVVVDTRNCPLSGICCSDGLSSAGCWIDFGVVAGIVYVSMVECRITPWTCTNVLHSNNTNIK